MRRILAFAPLLLAACAAEPPAKVEEAAAASLDAGQWEVTRSVTKVTKMDDGAAALPATVGSTDRFAVCVAPADRNTPPTDLLTGTQGVECATDSLYLRGGRVNAALSCSPAGLDGKAFVSSSGTFAAKTLDLSVSTATQLAGTGDVRVEASVSARHAGACNPSTPATPAS